MATSHLAWLLFALCLVGVSYGQGGLDGPVDEPTGGTDGPPTGGRRGNPGDGYRPRPRHHKHPRVIYVPSPVPVHVPPRVIYVPNPVPNPIPVPVPVPVDDEPDVPEPPIAHDDIEVALRSRIFAADVPGAAKVLRSSREFSLGAGLTFGEKLAPRVVQTKDRNKDPDVVAFKALALSAIETRLNEKLGRVITISFKPDCECKVLNSTELDDAREGFSEDFKDIKRMHEIVKADANTEFVPENTGRKLKCISCSPVSSTACHSCWPSRECSRMSWCP